MKDPLSLFIISYFSNEMQMVAMLMLMMMPLWHGCDGDDDDE
jgi:hypothetical protein